MSTRKDAQSLNLYLRIHGRYDITTQVNNQRFIPVSRRMFKVMEEESTDPPDTVPSSLRTIISGFLVFSQTQNVMYL